MVALDFATVVASGVGSWPGHDFADAVKISFAECPDLPYLPELPARGPGAGLIGRGTALLPGLGFDLTSVGWRLVGVSGRDHRRAISLLRSDLDQLEEQAQGYCGPLKLAVAGPWTLAASLEHPRGDRVLPDSGARREIAQSLAQGLTELIAELGRRLPGLTPIIQLDEPLLPMVLAGELATASGLARHRAIDIPEVSTVYTQLSGQLAGHPSLVHCCAAKPPIAMLAAAGVTGIGLDLSLLTTADWDALGAALESGTWLFAGALPTSQPAAVPMKSDQVASNVLKPLRTLGLPPEISGHTVITPACGLAGWSQPAAVRALRTVAKAAEIVSEGIHD